MLMLLVDIFNLFFSAEPPAEQDLDGEPRKIEIHPGLGMQSFGYMLTRHYLEEARRKKKREFLA